MLLAGMTTVGYYVFLKKVPFGSNTIHKFEKILQL